MRACHRAAAVRTTPARAGRTAGPARLPQRPPDHPRSRGENAVIALTVLAAIGPPPLARGELDPPPRRPARRRTTPARAGRTQASRPPGVWTSDHPRSRGENVSGGPAVGTCEGPPPLARGEPPGGRAGLGQRRTTPARAGRTSPTTRAESARPDHPRSRGENGATSPTSAPSGGPPPLARGEHRLAVGAAQHRRTTPARAGRTHHPDSVDLARSDHPRSRGENSPGISRISSSRWTTPARAGRTVADLG